MQRLGEAKEVSCGTELREEDARSLLAIAKTEPNRIVAVCTGE